MEEPKQQRSRHQRWKVEHAARERANLNRYSEADKVLTRSNYQKWKDYTETLLGSRLLDAVVLDFDHEPSRKAFIDYEIKETCALRIIKEACGREMIHHIFYSKYPAEACNELINTYNLMSLLTYGELWTGAHKFFRDYPEALTAEITEDGSTALHVAVRLGKVDFVRELLKLMTAGESETKTHQGNTAMAAIVEMLVNSNARLLLIGNEHELLSVTIAAINRNEMIMRYLYEHTPKSSTKKWGTKTVASLLTSAARLDAFDIVRDLLNQFPDYALGLDYYGLTLLSVLTEKPSAFPSGNRFGPFGRWIYRSAGSKKQEKVLKALETIFPGVKQVLHIKEKHDNTSVILQHICSLLPNLDKINLRTTHGIIEVFENLIDTNPYLEHYKDENERGLFQISIMARQENIFQYIYQMGQRNQSMTLFDKFGNNALHCAAYLDISLQLDKVHGPALQMQRELQWFEEIERVVPPRYVGLKNKEHVEQEANRTPREIFSCEHKGLAKEGEKWMKETAQACMIVTTLIATVMFAAAFTLPGGSDQNTGIPLSANTPSFKVFIVSDALSLFSSSTSILMFFSILTSRYAERDFLTSLPKKMILGLSTLFISIATMMATFAATLVIVLRGQASWVYIPVSILASIPVILFGLLQLPLFFNILSSTYGRGIFHMKKKRDYAPLTGICYG
ncbi:hypothetical protein MKX03_015373 [Papaver bracteatum]|nr:hypothetical protein MKX03_015373 [Papaver bracteatum]